MSLKKIPCACSRGAAFVSHELGEGLFALRCPDCRNVLVSLAEFWRWRARHVPDWNEKMPEPVYSEGETASRARTCPVCQRIMTRYRTGGAKSFWIDHCAACELVWLDAGEWEVLEEEGLAPYLDTILDESWQKRILALRNAALSETLLRTRFGEATLAEIRRFKQWMNAQANARDILAFLNDPAAE
jgi:Zn-finger nucleic acid-binding protein